MQDEIKLEGLLGQGGFGIVFLVKHNKYKKSALKIIVPREGDANCHEGEIGIQLKHQNIVKCFEFRPNCTQTFPFTRQVNKLLKRKGLSDRKISGLLKCHFLFTELCNGGDLQTWVTQPNEPTRTRDTVNNFFAQIVEGVDFLHTEHNLIHGDLKLANFLLHHTKNGTIIKIGDFGEAIVEGESGKGDNRRLAFTELYSDPKERTLSRRTKGYDIYSLACVFVAMFISESCHFDKHLIPNKEEREKALTQLVLSVKRNEKGLAAVTKNAYSCRESMVRQMLTSNLQERVSVSAVKEIFANIAHQPQLFSLACPVPKQNPTFSGRKKMIRDLAKLSESDAQSPTFILLHGIPGTGKKSIASELCHQYCESNKVFSRGIFWFRADSRRVLQNSYSKLMEEKKFIRNIKELISWLEQGSTGSDRLLTVYENVKCYAEIQDLLPHYGNSVVICTSRTDSADWPQEYQKLVVPLLPMKDCMAFVNSSMKLVNLHWDQDYYAEREHVERLVIKMGQLTTPIGHALAFIANKSNDISFISDYLKLYENSIPAEVLPYHAALLTTTKKIKEINPTAFTWLRICSYLDSEGIPEVLLETLLNTEENKGLSQDKNEIIELLSAYTVMEYDNRTQSFFMPRAVQECIQTKYKSSFLKTMSTIGSLLRVVIPLKKKFGKDNQRAIKLRELTPHLEALVDHIIKHEVSESPTNCFLNCQGKDELNNIRIMKLEMLKTLNRVYTSQSNSNKIHSTVEQITLIKDEVFGETDWRRGLELMTKGKALMKTALRNQPTIPIETPEKMFDAIKILEEAKIVFKGCRNSGLRVEIVQCYLHLGRCFRSFLHPKYIHPEKRCQISAEILGKVDNYAQSCKQYYAEALQLLLELATAKRNVSRMICLALRELASSYYFQQDFLNYEKHLLLALMSSGVRIEGQGDNPEVVPPIIETLMDIASFQVDGNTSFYDGLIGDSHPNPEEAYIIVEMLTKFYKHDKKVDAPLKMLNRYRNRLRTIKKKMKSRKNSTPLPQNDEERSETNMSPDILANEKMTLATELKRQRNIQGALLLYQEALELIVSFHKRESVMIANVYERIGECHSRLGDTTQACRNYKEAYKLWGTDVRRLSEKDKTPEFAQLIQKYVRALPKSKSELKVKLLQECVSIMETTFGKNHLQIGIYKEKIGTILLNLKRYQAAVQPLEEGYELLQNLPSGNFSKLRCLESLVKVSEALAEKQDLVEGYTTTLEAETKAAAEGYQRTQRAERTRRKRHKLKRNRGITADKHLERNNLTSE